MTIGTKPRVVLLVLLVLFTSVWFGPRPARAVLNDSLPAKVALNPSSIASLSLQPGSTVTFDSNVTNAQPFAGFIVAIFFNSSVLHFSGLDYSGGVFENDVLVVSECVDGLSVPGAVGTCFADTTFDGTGVVSLTLATNSGQNMATPNGKLFSVTFNVVGSGLSSLHFVRYFLGTAPNGTPLPVVAFDGYFTNIDCPSGTGNMCKPPIVSFTPPVEPGINQSELFRATAVSQNPNGVITEYNWTWGSGQAKQYYNSPPRGTGTPSPSATLIFEFSDINQVTLSAQDNYGARAYYSISILVVRSSVDVSGFFTDASLNPLPIFGINPRVNVVLANGRVGSTNPGQILVWVNVTNTGVIRLQSLKLNETLPFDWTLNPAWMPGKGAIHIYYANTSALATNPEITDPSTINVTGQNPQTLILAIPNLNATLIGHPLMPGQSILLSVKLSYSLLMTTQSPLSYPRSYFVPASAIAWRQPSYTGTEAPERGFLGFFMSFRAYANIVGLRSSPTIV